MVKEVLDPVYVVPGYTFFYWGFTVPKRYLSRYAKYFSLRQGQLDVPISLVIAGKKHTAHLRIARQTSPKYPQRNVLQIHYESERQTLKSLRKMFAYSYAATINKQKPKLKEVLMVEHVNKSQFKVVPIARQTTDFDAMFDYMEDIGIFDAWKQKKEHKSNRMFLEYSRSWLPVSELIKYRDRVNVVYILYDSKSKIVYVGKAIKLGQRLKVGKGRVAMPHWDKFMFFQLHPQHAPYIEQLEAFATAALATIIPNNIKIHSAMPRGIRLANLNLRL